MADVAVGVQGAQWCVTRLDWVSRARCASIPGGSAEVWRNAGGQGGNGGQQKWEGSGGSPVVAGEARGREDSGNKSSDFPT